MYFYFVDLKPGDLVFSFCIVWRLLSLVCEIVLLDCVSGNMPLFSVLV